jgi:hypothetical protein
MALRGEGMVSIGILALQEHTALNLRLAPTDAFSKG